MALFQWKRKKEGDQSAQVSADGEFRPDISEAFSTDDRTVYAQTADSAAIAQDILECAQQVAEDKRSGEEFSVLLESKHPDVHHMEITMSVMMAAGGYGLMPGAVHNNRFYFTKR